VAALQVEIFELCSSLFAFLSYDFSQEHAYPHEQMGTVAVSVPETAIDI
jgi:hypothetical protein